MTLLAAIMLLKLGWEVLTLKLSKVSPDSPESSALGKLHSVVEDSYCDRVQQFCNLVAFKMFASKMGSRSVTTQSVTILKVTLLCQEGDGFSLQMNGVKLAIACSLFVIIQRLSVINLWKSKLAIYKHSY